MRFLVTGGAGFIGSHLCERLIEEGHDVVCLDNFNTYYDPKIKRHNISGLSHQARFRLVEGDILDGPSMHALFDSSRFDTVVHLAARAGVRPSIDDPMLYQRVNIEGTMHLLEAAVKTNVSRFVMASSSSVYGNNEKVPFSEADPVDHPISPYAATKKACELLGYTYHKLHGLPVSCLRFFTVYGPRQRPDMAIHKFTKLIAEGKPIPVFGDGSSRRDYTYIDDIIQGLRQAIDHCQDYQVYNLGESQTIALIDLIGLIERHLGKKAEIQWLETQPGDVRITYADIRKAQNELGYCPTTPVEEGIAKFIDWFKNGTE